MLCEFQYFCLYLFLSLLSQEVFPNSCLWVGGASPRPAPTCRQHLGAFAEAVVVVCITGAEVGALEDQAALVPRRPAVPTQRKPGGHPEVVMGERPRVRLGLVEERALLWLFWEGEPQPGGTWAISPPGLHSLSAPSQGPSTHCVPGLPHFAEPVLQKSEHDHGNNNSENNG